MHRPPTTLRPAWWCQLLTNWPNDAECWKQLPGHLAPRPESALVWMRSEVRTLVSGFDPGHAERAYWWLDAGQWEAIYRLRAGEHYVLDATMRGARVELSIRPVLPLPRAPLRPTSASVCSVPARCQCIAPDHECTPGKGRA